MIVAGTGHRPEDCQSEGHVRIVTNVKLRTTHCIEVFISGMAAGFDLWAADEALDLGIKVWAARPWAGHGPRKGDEELYERVLKNAKRRIDVSPALNYPGPQVYQTRNVWMVDHADVVLAYWNEDKQSGGTFNCVQYANDNEVPIANVYYDPPF